MKKEINVTLGQRVKELRKQKGYTREAFAEELSVSTRFLADVESGSAGVSITTLKNISMILNVPSDYFIGISNPEDSELSRQILMNKVIVLDKKYLGYVNTILDCVMGIAEA